MRGRWAALGIALILTMGLTACGAGTSQGVETDRLSNRGTSGTETPAARSRNLWDDAQYYAGADGEVTRRRDTGESEWEKLGRELRESWDRMMDKTEDAAQDLEQDARDVTGNETR